MPAQAPTERRSGRPPQRDGVAPTRERLLDAAIDVFVDDGFANASVTEVAERAGISGPAVYKHFAGKAELFIEAARRSLDETLADAPDDPQARVDPVEIAHRWLGDGFAATRRLLLELHLAGGRDCDVAGLLASWHLERTTAWQARRGDPVERVTAFYLLLLGLAQVDALAALEPDPARLRTEVDRMVAALFPPTATP